MKAIFITYDQAHHEAILDILQRLNCRGYTTWGEVYGRGSSQGEPHLNSHAWPGINGAIMTMVRDDRARTVMDRLRQLDQERPKLGLRAFVWNVEDSI